MAAAPVAAVASLGPPTVAASAERSRLSFLIPSTGRPSVIRVQRGCVSRPPQWLATRAVAARYGPGRSHSDGRVPGSRSHPSGCTLSATAERGQSLAISQLLRWAASSVSPTHGPSSFRISSMYAVAPSRCAAELDSIPDSSMVSTRVNRGVRGSSPRREPKHFQYNSIPGDRDSVVRTDGHIGHEQPHDSARSSSVMVAATSGHRFAMSRPAASTLEVASRRRKR